MGLGRQENWAIKVGKRLLADTGWPNKHWAANLDLGDKLILDTSMANGIRADEEAELYLPLQVGLELG